MNTRCVITPAVPRPGTGASADATFMLAVKRGNPRIEAAVRPLSHFWRSG